MVEYEGLHSSEEKGKLSERVKQLEKTIASQMKMIKEQQFLIETQECFIKNKKNGDSSYRREKSFDDSLEDLIDREENCFDSDEDENLPIEYQMRQLS